MWRRLFAHCSKNSGGVGGGKGGPTHCVCALAKGLLGDAQQVSSMNMGAGALAGGVLHPAQWAHVQRTGDALPGHQGALPGGGAGTERGELRGAGTPQAAQPHPLRRACLRERQCLPPGLYSLP